MNSGPEIQVADLPSSVTGKNSTTIVDGDGSDKIIPISELERKTILNTITQLNGDKLLAARLLGIGKTTLYLKPREIPRHSSARAFSSGPRNLARVLNLHANVLGSKPRSPSRNETHSTRTICVTTVLSIASLWQVTCH